LPFRLFTISLMFRMASKISDACIKAAGVVYSWALLQFAYAGLVIAGAILGQRWGVAGVAVCVSIAMGLDWLNMAHLSRKVTGLPWRRFAAAHLPAICLSVLIAVAAVLAASAARSAHLGNVPVLIAAGTAAALAGAGASYLLPAIFLGDHGRWALKQGERLLRRQPAPNGRAEPPDPDRLAPVGEARSK
jgi:PST family polysaccharide transporter